MGESVEKKRYTIEEYFALEETSEIRHEYFDGEIFAMAGTTLNHSRLASNIEFSIRKQRKQHCDVFRESVKLVLYLVGCAMVKLYVYSKLRMKEEGIRK